MWLCAVEEKTVDATADVAEVCFVAWFEFCDDATGVANFCEGRSHCRPVDVAEVEPGITAFFAFEIFEVDLDDTPAESATSTATGFSRYTCFPEATTAVRWSG